MRTASILFTCERVVHSIERVIWYFRKKENNPLAPFSGEKAVEV
jgi:hypothetical protein